MNAAAEETGAAPELLDAYTRAASEAGDGDRRAWKIGAPGSAVTFEQVSRWVRSLLTGPWCLPATTARDACQRLEELLAEAGQPARVEVLRRVAATKDPTRDEPVQVYLAARALDRDVPGHPRLALVLAHTERRGPET